MSLYTIPIGTSFVDALAAGIFAQYSADPLALSKLTILLPARRAARTLRDAFLRITGGQPLLLPTIRAAADADEDALFLNAGQATLDIPPAIDPLARKIILARYLMASRPDDFTLPQALAMSADLARFLDAVHTWHLSLDDLDNLVPAEYAAHWQVNLEFLKDVLRAHWPTQLAAEGAIDIGAHRRLLLEAQTAYLQQGPQDAHIIAAGFATPTPAVCDLLKTIDAMPNGQVVFAGLDLELENTAWTDHLEWGHPQAGLAALLLALGKTRTDVSIWPQAPTTHPRASLASTLMRPPATLSAWARAPLAPEAFQNLTLLEADTLDDEALSIALMMRAHADDPTRGDTCALITPDRTLARRVALNLQRWGIKIDDSAGTPLSQTPIGKWLLLLADVLADKLEPVGFLALLKSAFAAGGPEWPQTAPPYRNFVRALDKHILRGTRLAEGFDGMLHAAQTKPDILAGLQYLQTLFTPALACPDDPHARLQTLITLAENLATTPDTSGTDRLWAGEAGEAAANALTHLLEHAAITPAIAANTLSSLLKNAFEAIAVRPRYGTHPRLSILGLIEARLYQADTLILGALNEGTWPAPPSVDGWLSRPMRARFGLPALEEHLTLAAHDFACALGATHVTLTRAKFRDGAPTTPARWIERLDTLAAAQGTPPDLRGPARYWLDLATQLDAYTGPSITSTRPAPNPALSARPTTLSVTEIARLRRDPYAIYAKHILRLKPLKPIAATPDAAERGTLIHTALEDFGKQYPHDLPDHAYETLIAIGRTAFDAAHQHPDITGHWWPRFERMAAAFIAHEKSWRAGLIKLYTEVEGLLDIDLDAHTKFTLKGRADRIENRTDGWAIIDYKTGTLPSKKAAENADEPQLALLGLMLLSGAFNEACDQQTQPEHLGTLGYWKTGSTKDTLETTTLPTPETLADHAHQGLRALMHSYLCTPQAYPSWPDATQSPRTDDDYAHLARVAAWRMDESTGDE